MNSFNLYLEFPGSYRKASVERKGLKQPKLRLRNSMSFLLNSQQVDLSALDGLATSLLITLKVNFVFLSQHGPYYSCFQ